MGFSVDYRETLVTYLRSDSIEDAARNLGLSKASMSQRLVTMRRAGVKIPKKRKKILDELMVAQLNSLISKHKKEA